jgi:hypothetical protein
MYNDYYSDNLYNTMFESDIMEACSKYDVQYVKNIYNPIKDRQYLDLMLYNSCLYNNIEVCEWLLDIGADIHYKQDYCLRIACKYGFLDLIDILLKRGADVRAKNDECFISLCSSGYIDVANDFYKIGCNPFAQENDALISACRNKKFNIADWLLSLGADIHTKKDCILNWALISWNFDLLNWLLERDIFKVSNKFGLEHVFKSHGYIDKSIINKELSKFFINDISYEISKYFIICI